MAFVNLFTVALVIVSPTLAIEHLSSNASGVLPNGKYEISSRGIRAQFVPYGASLSNLFITDARGVERDIVLGFDNATYYSQSALHPHLNGVAGRYVNRIKNGTFAIDGVTYHTDLNDHGLDTLHGGSNGWDYRNWTVDSHSWDSITFSLIDPDGEEGFPGEVTAYATYTVTPYEWHLRMIARSTTKKTPIMLTSHTYLNLDGFRNPNTSLALNHTLYMPYSGQRIATDSILIPTGDVLGNTQYGVHDFWSSPKQLAANITSPDLLGACGYNCTGYDTCYPFNRQAQLGRFYDWKSAPVATLTSQWSGIELDIYTNQRAMQVYTCNNMNGTPACNLNICNLPSADAKLGTFALKETQGFFNDSSRPRVVQKYGCVVLEVEDWIDGINQPEWGRDRLQVFGPHDRPYVLEARYRFSLNGTAA